MTGKSKIALALYTIRDKLSTAADYAQCLKQVRKIGYEGVEGSAIDAMTDVREYKKILDGEGLICCSNHAGEGDLREKFDTLVANAQLLCCTAIVFPYLPEKYWTEAGVKSAAAFLNETGAKLRKEAISLSWRMPSPLRSGALVPTPRGSKPPPLKPLE